MSAKKKPQTHARLKRRKKHAPKPGTTEACDELKKQLIQEALEVDNPNPHGRQPVEITRPGDCATAFEMRAHGATFREITSETGIARDQLRRIFRKRPEILEKMKKAAAVDHLMLAEMYNEAQMRKAEALCTDDDQLAATSPQHIALAAAINTDKALALSGQANVIVEHRKGITLEDAQAAIEEARAKVRERAMEVEAEIVSEG